MAYRLGFKTEANEIAREIRREMGLRAADPLDPWRLAEHLAIPVVPLSSLASCVSRAVRYLTRVEAGAFSAATVFRGTARVIVYNDSHVHGRQASDVAHELSHALLRHTPRPVLDGHGSRDWNQDEEGEANWLAGALLVSEEAALAVVRAKLSILEAAERYGVSMRMMQFRINVTAARRRVARGQRYRRRLKEVRGA